MDAISYLMRTIVKNKLLQLKKKPALLIVYLIVIASFVLVLVSAAFTKNAVTRDHYADIRLLYSIIAGLGVMFLITFVGSGLEKGSSLFSMSDVGLLFVAPISSKKILMYGLLKQLGTTILTSVFILFQAGNIQNSFNMNGVMVFMLFIVYACMLFFGQLLSMAIYVYSNGNAQRKKIIQLFLYGLITLVVVIGFLKYTQLNSISEAIYQVVDSVGFGLIPVAGWPILIVKGCVEGKIVLTLIGFALFFLVGSFVVMSFTSGDADYYEDVLISTESNYQRIQDAKAGKMVNVSKKVKVNDSNEGLKGGFGASTIFYRHLHEMKRVNRIPFISKFTIITAIASGVISSMKPSRFLPYIIFGILIYFLIFSTLSSKLTWELTKPYIYLIPDTPMRKLIFSCLCNWLKPLIDGFIIFTVIGICSKGDILLCFLLAIAYGSTGALLTSLTVLYQRFFGGQPNQFVAVMISILMLIVVPAPGIIISVFVTMHLPQQLSFIGVIPYVVVCILFSTIILVTCKNLFEKSDYTGKN